MTFGQEVNPLIAPLVLVVKEGSTMEEGSTSPTPSIHSSFSDSKLDLNQIAGLSKSYIITPDASFQVNDEDRFSDDDDLGMALTDDMHPDLFNQSITHNQHKHNDVMVDNDDFHPPIGLAETNRLDTITEEQSHVGSELFAEASTRSFRRSNISSQSGINAFVDSGQFDNHSRNVVDLLDRTELKFKEENRFRQDDAQFGMDYHEADNSWEPLDAESAQCPLYIPPAKRIGEEKNSMVSEEPLVSTPYGMPTGRRKNSSCSRLSHNFGSVSALSLSSNGAIKNNAVEVLSEMTNLDVSSKRSSLSRTAIARCLHNASIGAECGALAKAILNANDMCNKKKKKKKEEENEDNKRQQVSSGVSGVVEASHCQLLFGCVQLTEKAVQAIRFHNKSADFIRLKLHILRPHKGFDLPDSESFVYVRPDERFSVRVRFCPIQKATYNNILRLTATNTFVQYSIRLQGMGGCANVLLLNDSNLTLSRKGTYFLNACRPSITLSNIGCRDAFVLIVAVHRDHQQSAAASSVLDKCPTYALILHRNETRELTVDVRKWAEANNLETSSSSITAFAADGCANLARFQIFWGEETLRQRLKIYELRRGKPQIITGRSFTGRFLGEQNDFSLEDNIIVDKTDVDVFISSLRQTIIKIVSMELSVTGGDRSVGICLDKEMDRNQTDASFAVLDPDATVTADFGRSIVPDMTAAVADISPKRSRFCHSPPEKECKVATNTLGQSINKVLCKETEVKFVKTKVGAWDSVKVELKNISNESNKMRFTVDGASFSVKIAEYCIDAMKFVRIPIYFQPRSVGYKTGNLTITQENGHVIYVKLCGSCYH